MKMKCVERNISLAELEDCLEEYEKTFTSTQKQISALADQFSKEAQKFSIGKGNPEKIDDILTKIEELEAKQHKIVSLFVEMFGNPGNKGDSDT